MASMDATTQARWFHLTPGRFVIGLLVVEVLLWLSERIGWLGWHKGYAVLTCVVLVGGAICLMLFWFVAALIFRWRSQFSLRSLLLSAVVVALPCSWMAVEIRAARNQQETVELVRRRGGFITYDYQLDAFGNLESARVPPVDYGRRRHLRAEDLMGPGVPYGPRWLHSVLGDDFFASVVRIQIYWFYGSELPPSDLVPGSIFTIPNQLSEADMKQISSLSHLSELDLRRAAFASDKAVEKLQQALPNCKITR
jgi:hypothetical protein